MALHITNGDCAVEALRDAGMTGDFLPWRDVLHEGPLDPSLPLERLSGIRARFIADSGWASLEEARGQFEARDARLRRSADDEEVVLWFEHDLYDQLQLVQVLAWFHAHPHPRLALVCEAEYLGEMNSDRAVELFARRRPVTDLQLNAAARAWRELPDGRGFPELRFLDAALERWAAERAAPSRTERLIVEALADGPLEFGELFRRTQAHDEPRFLGDTVFLERLQRLEAQKIIRRDEKGSWTRL